MKVFYKFPATLLLFLISVLVLTAACSEASQNECQKNVKSTVTSQCHEAENSCGSFCSSGMREKIAWGRWSLIDNRYYRQVFAPGPNVRGVQLYADESGNLYRRPVLPDGVLSLVDDIPEWFSVEGMGISPEKTLNKNSEVSSKDGFTPATDLYSSMRWGKWSKVEGKALRQFFPPGGRRLGAQFFSDTDGWCYSRSVVPNARAQTMERPEWFSTEGMGTPPMDMSGI